MKRHIGIWFVLLSTSWVVLSDTSAFGNNFCSTEGPPHTCATCAGKEGATVPSVEQPARSIEAVDKAVALKPSEVLVQGALVNKTSDFMKELFENPEQKSSADYVKVLIQNVSSLGAGQLQIAHANREVLSGEHQLDVIHAITPTALRYLKSLPGGFDFDAYQIGVANSDMGKLDEYKKLLTEPSQKSDLLLGVLSGDLESRSTDALREMMNEAGLGPKGPHGPLFLSSHGNTQNLRDVFKTVGPLPNYLHALPGVADSIVAFEHGFISKDLFKASLRANFFHNGPPGGFWKRLSYEFVAGAFKNTCQNGIKIFEGTPYAPASSDNPFALSYPITTSFEGSIHTFFDRLSQGTRGGLTKIYEELPYFDPLRRIYDLGLSNNSGTQQQLDILNEQLAHEKKISAPQHKIVEALVIEGKKRLDQHDSYLKAHIQFADIHEVELKFGKETLPHKITFNYADKTSETVVYDRAHDKCLLGGKTLSGCAGEIYNRYHRVLVEEEAVNQDPMLTLFARAMPHVTH